VAVAVAAAMAAAAVVAAAAATATAVADGEPGKADLVCCHPRRFTRAVSPVQEVG
jgi:hypothetical protein